MARFKNFRKRFSGYGSRAKSWGRKNKRGIGLSGTFIAGVAVGLTEYDKLLPYEAKIAIACLPNAVTNKVPSGGAIVQLVRGMLIGDIIQARTGFNLAGAASSTSGSFGV